MQRPDRLRIVNLGDGPASEFYFDGKAMMAYAPAENLVAVAEAPPTIDGALKQAFLAAGIYFPFTDLLVADPYAALAEGVKTAFYIGSSGFVGGVRTEMVAVATDDVFMQIWLGTEDKLPRRIRAVFSADPLRLRHDMGCRTGSSIRNCRPRPSYLRRHRARRRWSSAIPRPSRRRERRRSRSGSRLRPVPPSLQGARNEEGT